MRPAADWPTLLCVLAAATTSLRGVTSLGDVKPHLQYITDARLTSDVNLERYYILEEDLLSNVEVLLRDDYFEAADGELEAEHAHHKPDLSPIESTINRTKSIHSEAGRDIPGFLSHPVNVFHLLRRLNTEWKAGLDVVLRTKLCREWKVPGMVRHLRYVRNRLPGVNEIDMVIGFLIHHLKLFGPFGKEAKSGRVGDFLATQPLEVEDQYIIGRSLYEKEDFLAAIPWLELVSEWFGQAKEDQKNNTSFSLKSTLNMLATAYYQVKKPTAAVEVVERLLKVEPSNQLARGNLAFFRTKAQEQAKEEQEEQNQPGEEDGEEGKRRPKRAVKTDKSPFERFCLNPITKPSRQKCVYEPMGTTSQPFWYQVYKKEILQVRPPMYIYHDFISAKTADQLKEYSFNTISDRSWTSDAFRLPRLRLLFQYPFIYPLELRKKARKVVQTLRDLPKPNPSLLQSFGPFQVFTSGLEGMHLADYASKLDLVPMNDEKHVGAYFLFLSEAKQGGNVVMPRRGFNFYPSKGSVLFYHSTKSTPHSFCPSIGGSVWAAVQPFYEVASRQCPLWHRFMESHRR